MTSTEWALEFKNVTKRFQGVAAVQDVNLSIKKGEIHALLGENGAGKSTLMNILVGLYLPDEGDIFINGNKVAIKGPKDAIELGIGMIHQHFKLVEQLSVSENIIIGYKKQRFVISKHNLNKEIREMSESYDLPINPEAIVKDLSAGEKQRVEIVKMLYRNVEFLILDEPTSVLTPQEKDKLFDYLRAMKKQGKTVIFISHKLNEVMEIADRVTILRSGKLIETMDKSATSPQEIAKKMIGRERQVIEKKYHDPDIISKDMLEAANICALGDEGDIALREINLKIAAGEILGIAGVSGNGQTELGEVLTGMRPLKSGFIKLDGAEIAGSPMKFIAAGVSHVPEDRIGTGSIPSFSCIDNVILKKYNKPPIKKGIVLNRKEAESAALKMLEEFDVRMSSPQIPVRFLSGGNMQKLIFAREINHNPKLIVAVHPTYGLDVAAIDMVHKCLIAEQQKGCAILLISEDLDEIFTLADTIAVMYHGTLSDKKHRNDWTIDEIGYAMMGISAASDENAVASSETEEVAL